MVRIGAAAMMACPVPLAAPALANDLGSAPPAIDTRVKRVTVAPSRLPDLRVLRLLPQVRRNRSHRLSDTATVGPGVDRPLRARLRGVPLWEKTGDDAAFALGVSPVAGRLTGALRIVR